MVYVTLNVSIDEPSCLFVLNLIQTIKQPLCLFRRCTDTLFYCSWSCWSTVRIIFYAKIYQLFLVPLF